MPLWLPFANLCNLVIQSESADDSVNDSDDDNNNKPKINKDTESIKDIQKQLKSHGPHLKNHVTNVSQFLANDDNNDDQQK